MDSILSFWYAMGLPLQCVVTWVLCAIIILFWLFVIEVRHSAPMPKDWTQVDVITFDLILT